MRTGARRTYQLVVPEGGWEAALEWEEGFQGPLPSRKWLRLKPLREWECQRCWPTAE